MVKYVPRKLLPYCTDLECWLPDPGQSTLSIFYKVILKLESLLQKESYWEYTSHMVLP